MVDRSSNAAIWENIYANGRSLWYPYEVAVRIVHYLGSHGRLEGTILDHGCGSANHLEMFFRLGYRAIGTEISKSAINLVSARFSGAKLKAPHVSLVDPEQPLPGQLPPYDHVFAWCSVHYNRVAKVKADLLDLIGSLPKGGSFILAIPTTNDVVVQQAEREIDGSYRIVGTVSNQGGALVTVPQSDDELRDWLPGIAIDDLGTFGWTFRGIRSEFFFLYGARS